MTEEQIKKLEQAKRLLDECLMLSGENSEVSRGVRTEKKSTLSDSKSYSGPKGGIMLLIDRDFFKSKKTLEEAQEALEKENYIYKKDVIRVALYRLSKPNGPLIRIEEKDNKFYVKRK